MNHPKLAALVAVFCFAVPLAAQSTSYDFANGTPEDEAQIRQLITIVSDKGTSAQMAANLDWENAFGVRYDNLKQRDAYYTNVVKPENRDDADNATLEIKIRFIKPDVAVADEYWHIVGPTDTATMERGADRFGRTTATFVKEYGKWKEVVERIADLREPYYKHLDAMPVAARVPAATLASYAGAYKADGKADRVVAVAGNHLTITSEGRAWNAIPQSDTEFLVFRGNDFAQYWRARFSKAADGAITMGYEEAWGAQIASYAKQQAGTAGK